MAVSVYMSIKFSSKTPGARPVTGARDKPLRNVHSCRKHKLVEGFCCCLYLALNGVKEGKVRMGVGGCDEEVASLTKKKTKTKKTKKKNRMQKSLP